MNKEFVLRLTKYKRLIHKLKSLGFEKVFSNNLGDAIGVTPALVRKDFSTLHLPGNKRGGYNIDMLVKEFGIILGKNNPKNVIIIGCGKIGQALMQYPGFVSDDIHIVAGFDKAHADIKIDVPVSILGMDKLGSFVTENNIQVGIITVPGDEATNVLDQMVDIGIRGVLNFAPVELKCHKFDYDCRCIIHNVNIGLELEHLFYQIATQNLDSAGSHKNSDKAVQP